MNSTDEESDWDEIEIPLPPAQQSLTGTIDIPLAEPEHHHRLEHDIEITLTKTGGTNKQQQEEATAKRQAAAQNRLVRLESHKLHAVALLTSLSIRNKWLNDQVLKARLLSLIPLPIQHSFTSITKSAHPDPARRGRLFETALSRLVDWFAPSSTLAVQNSYIGRPAGWFQIRRAGHIVPHTFEAASIRAQVLQKRASEREARRAKREERRAKRARARVKGKGKAREVSSSSSSDDGGLEDEDSESEWYAPEPLRSANSIAKHALQHSGTRDMAALIFVAMVRALGIPARLVASLQCVSWSAPKDYSSKKTRTKRGVSTATSVHSDQNSAEGDVEMEEVVVPVTSMSRIGTPGSVGRRVALSVETPPRRRLMDDNSDSSASLQIGAKRKRPTPSKKGADIHSNRSIRDVAKDTSTTRSTNQSGSESRGRKNAIERVDNSDAAANPVPKASPIPHTIKLRRTKPAGNILGAAPATPWGPAVAGGGAASVDGPPTLWAEVFSRPDGRWLPVDPVRGIVNRAGVFEERDKAGRKKSNKLVYVVAMEEDGFARDVTARYARNFGAHVARARARVAAGGRHGKVEWWDSVMRVLQRPYALHRDDVEDAELSHQRALEGLPASIGAFKDHPIYALERHLRREEAIYPRTEIAHFRGEPVFPRQNVLSLKPADGWMRQGRVLRAGMQPIKKVKARASTVRKKRELEMRREEEGEVMVGMYAHWQTELYTPPPVIDGKIPTNGFGNVDLYVPTMLPEGAVHVPHKGCAKVARKLGIHFAEAVTGFEFRKRQATPIITGIVIAAENEQAFLEALASHTRAEQLKEAAKRRERVLQRWARLVQGLRIVRRLNEQYSNTRENNPLDIDHDADGVESEEPGGFLDDLKDVVRPYNLPEAQHLVPKLASDADEEKSSTSSKRPTLPTFQIVHDAFGSPYGNPLEPNDDAEKIAPEFEDITDGAHQHTQHSGPPLTMQQLADQQSKAQTQANSEMSSSSGGDELDAPPQIAAQQHVQLKKPAATRAKKITGGNIADEAGHDDSEYVENNVGSTRSTRASHLRRNAPLPSADDDVPTSTRTLRPRRRP
ncbi:Rad4-domain-containing protein [Ceratobasidium sp. AG-I]|nr:Rad4-domain-containing protein [Ceratobasidium sp. AG-I]